MKALTYSLIIVCFSLIVWQLTRSCPSPQTELTLSSLTFAAGRFCKLTLSSGSAPPMHSFSCAQLLSLLLLVVIRAHRRIKLAWRCTIYDLSTSSQQYLLRSVDHAGVLIVASCMPLRLLVLTILLLLEHLLVLHLVQLLLLLLHVELRLLLRPGRLHGDCLRANHC